MTTKRRDDLAEQYRPDGTPGAMMGISQDSYVAAIRDAFKSGYDQGRSDAIEEVLDLFPVIVADDNAVEVLKSTMLKIKALKEKV